MATLTHDEERVRARMVELYRDMHTSDGLTPPMAVAMLAMRAPDLGTRARLLAERYAELAYLSKEWKKYEKAHRQPDVGWMMDAVKPASTALCVAAQGIFTGDAMPCIDVGTAYGKVRVHRPGSTLQEADGEIRLRLDEAVALFSHVCTEHNIQLPPNLLNLLLNKRVAMLLLTTLGKPTIEMIK